MSTRPSGYGDAAAAAGLVAAMAVVAPCALADGAVSDAEALAIVRKHCVMCHAVKPTYAASQEAPNNVMLETIADFKKYAQVIYAQTVQNKAMPLGNQTGMSEDERAAVGCWVKVGP